ncbi:MAG: outer membrane beta-barrel protein [Kofleriaceae bacterium]
MRALLVVLALTSAASADSERSLSLGVGWATFSAPGVPVNNMEPVAIGPDIGCALAVSYEHMIGSDLGLRAELAGGVFYGGATGEQSKTTTALLADAGVVLRFDVLKYVPYAFGGIGALTTFGGPIEQGTSAALTVGGGLDILISRARSYGFEAKLASFGGDVTVFTVGVRGTIRWGYF